MIDSSFPIEAPPEGSCKWICMSKECHGRRVFLAPLLSEEPRILPVCPGCGHTAAAAYDG